MDSQTSVNEVTVFSNDIQIEFHSLGRGAVGCVIDNALADPDALVRFASRTRYAFAAAQPSGDPGLELLMAKAFTEKLGDFFRRRIRHLFEARRAISSHSLLTLATAPSDPTRTHSGIMPHRFGSPLHVGQCVAKCELYLFKDETLGGTGFYRQKPEATVATPDAFDRVAVVEARYNRLVFFDGGLLHASQLKPAEQRSTDPTEGRLTLEGYFVCQRRAGRISNRFMQYRSEKDKRAA
jgi:hypothetical protein